MKILNCTPHTINIYSVKDVVDVNDRHLHITDGAEAQVINPSGTVLSAKMVYEGEGYDVQRKYVGVDPAPECEDGDLIIVSALYASAVKELGGDTSKLRTVYGTVYDKADDRKVIGCIGLCRV